MAPECISLEKHAEPGAVSPASKVSPDRLSSVASPLRKRPQSKPLAASVEEQRQRPLTSIEEVQPPVRVLPPWLRQGRPSRAAQTDTRLCCSLASTSKPHCVTEPCKAGQSEPHCMTEPCKASQSEALCVTEPCKASQSEPHCVAETCTASSAKQASTQCLDKPRYVPPQRRQNMWDRATAREATENAVGSECIAFQEFDVRSKTKAPKSSIKLKTSSLAKDGVTHDQCGAESKERMDYLLRETFLTSVAKDWESVGLEGGESVQPAHVAKVESFIREHGLDRGGGGYTAADALRDCTSKVQLVVMQRGGLESARNRSATVLARIRDESDRFCLPVKGTKLYTLHMRPRRPVGTSLDVKFSSFKTLGRFFKSLEEEGLVTLKRFETDPLITAIHFDHPDLCAMGFPVQSWPGLDA